MFNINEYPKLVFNKLNPSNDDVEIISNDYIFEYKHLIFNSIKKYNLFREKLSLNDGFEYIFEIPAHFISNEFKFDEESFYIVTSMKEDEIADLDQKIQFMDNIVFKINCYYLQDKIETIINRIQKVKSNILLNPINDKSLSIGDYLTFVNQIHKLVLTMNLDNVFFPDDFIEKDTLMKHPCNIYACSGNSCHSSKSNHPRKLYVSEQSNIYVIDNEISVHKLINGTNFENMDTNVLKRFREVMIKIFEEFVINTNHQMVPIESLYKDFCRGIYE